MAAHPLVRRSSLLRSPPPRVLRRSRWHSPSSRAGRNQALTQRENQGRLAPPQKRGPFFAPNEAVSVRFGARFVREKAPFLPPFLCRMDPLAMSERPVTRVLSLCRNGTRARAQP